jgi:alanyl-tRNA synthetase
MKSSEIRSKFLGYFEKNSHRVVESSRLIPDGDPTILFTNAGMNQFKNLFLGLEKRDYSRAATSQKCLRAGGKHNDLENVGFTARHHTFFEMLGNFSFGDYFKKEAIHFAWEFLTKELGLPKDKLYVSVFETDDEAADIWHKQEGVPKDRIYRFGEKDNFWRMGNSGPCGPCSEIFYDLGPGVGGDPKENVMGGSGDRYMEIWNNVFMQFNETEDGKQTPLPRPSVDTGMGLERLTTVLQGKLSNYENDLFQTLIGRAQKISGVEYSFDLSKMNAADKARHEANNVAMRVLADHARATAFLIADGVLPSNDGRGYVLRRIMRRAIRYGRNLSKDKSLLPGVIESVIESMSGAYPELQKQRELVLGHTQDEEKRFIQTLDQGTSILSTELDKLSQKGGKVLDGKMAFKLYDTFGFPLDLTQLMTRERGFEVDEAGFNNQFEQAREVARSSWKAKGYTASQSHLIQLTQDVKQKNGTTEFLGYNGGLNTTGKIIATSNGEAVTQKLEAGKTGILILNKTTFYAESGGQMGDTGKIVTATGQAEVVDCTKTADMHIHHIRVVDGVIENGQEAQCFVDGAQRRNTASNHSATHLLHAALRKVLGTHITQAGSLVAADRLRFDFTHNKPISAEELEAIENLVNQEIAMANQVQTNEMTPDEAVKGGALALFGEKYGDKVRVLKMGDFSQELCGGTHVDNTAAIRLFKIVSEGGVSSGVRRMEAITGENAARFAMKNIKENAAARNAANIQENWQQYLSSDVSVSDWIEKSKNEKKQLSKEIQSLKGSKVDAAELIKAATPFSKGSYIFAEVAIDDRELLSQLSDKLVSQLKTGVVVLLGEGDPTSPLLVAVSKDLTGAVKAGAILGELAAIMGGKGGGRPDFAQGAIKDRALAAKAKARLAEILA